MQVKVLQVINVSEASFKEKRNPYVITEINEKEREDRFDQKSIYKYTVSTLGDNSLKYVIALKHAIPWKVNSQVEIPDNCENWRGIFVI